MGPNPFVILAFILRCLKATAMDKWMKIEAIPEIFWMLFSFFLLPPLQYNSYNDHSYKGYILFIADKSFSKDFPSGPLGRRVVWLLAFSGGQMVLKHNIFFYEFLSVPEACLCRIQAGQR